MTAPITDTSRGSPSGVMLRASEGRQPLLLPVSNKLHRSLKQFVPPSPNPRDRRLERNVRQDADQVLLRLAVVASDTHARECACKAAGDGGAHNVAVCAGRGGTDVVPSFRALT